MSAFQTAALRHLCVGAMLLLSPRVVSAQASGPALHGYDFLTVTVIESPYSTGSRILLAPAFQGKSEILLAANDLTANSVADKEKITQNMTVVNQELSELTAANWELVQVYSVAQVGYNPASTRYLFRKAKP